MFGRSISLSMVISLLGVAASAVAADAEHGKAKAQQACAECHEAADWKGKSEDELRAKIGDVAGGKMKHPKKLQLTDADMADIAAFWASSSK